LQKQKIDQPDKATPMQLAETLERLEAEKKQKDFGEKITSWEASAKPNDSVS
jgi:hypothetical protein